MRPKRPESSSQPARWIQIGVSFTFRTKPKANLALFDADPPGELLSLLPKQKGHKSIS